MRESVMLTTPAGEAEEYSSVGVPRTISTCLASSVSEATA